MSVQQKSPASNGTIAARVIGLIILAVAVIGWYAGTHQTVQSYDCNPVLNTCTVTSIPVTSTTGP